MATNGDNNMYLVARKLDQARTVSDSFADVSPALSTALSNVKRIENHGYKTVDELHAILGVVYSAIELAKKSLDDMAVGGLETGSFVSAPPIIPNASKDVPKDAS